MRAFDCVPPDDGHPGTMRLEAADDEALLVRTIEHTAQFHPALQLTHDQFRSIIRRGAYDVEPAGRI